MALETGTRLGPYEIVRQVGAGGMGEVYQATDTRLDRTVAIKVLPEHLASDPSRRERFEREAKAVSSLNHPHICTLYDVGEQDGTHYLVMELVEGETLESRLERGRLPLDQALEYAIQIADALDKAHRQGVVHRDLKPANIMITKSGVKLLDFGLAKLRGDASPTSGLSQAPTQDKSLTAEGTIIGTLQYMAPEQLEGAEADSRTDIFAFGAVVYEMVTGKKAFEGKSQASLIGAIMNSEPSPMSELQGMTPRSLDRIVRQCLAKDQDDRWQTAGDLMRELRWVDETESGSHGALVSSTRAVPRISIAVACVSLLAALGLAVVHFGEAPPSERTLRYVLPLPRESGGEGLYFQYQLSPDGRFIAVSGVIEQTSGIFVREMDSEEWEVVPGTNTGDFFWSPDSRSIAFFDSDRKLKRVSREGGPTAEIADVGSGSFFDASGTWSRDDVIVFAPPSGGQLLSVPANGGEEPQDLTQVEEGESHTHPSFLPDGQHFLYTSTGGANPGVYVASIDDPVGTRVLADRFNAVFAPAASGREYGHLVFIRDGRLMGQQFDLSTLAVRGDAFVITERALLTDNLGAAASVSDNGVLAYLGGRNRDTDSQLVWYDLSGNRLGTEGAMGPPTPVSLSPDQSKAAFLQLAMVGSSNGDVWQRDLTRGINMPLSRGGSVPPGTNVIWSPDGDRIAFSYESSDSSNGFYISDVGGSGTGDPIFENGNSKSLTDWTRDGYLLYTEMNPTTGTDIWYLQLTEGDEGLEPTAFLQTEWDESFGNVSPNGQWIAYVSNESGSYEVWVRRFPSGTEPFRVSASDNDSGTTQQPLWNPDGSGLFYVSGSGGKLTMMMAPTAPSPSPGSSPVLAGQPLFELRVNAFAPTSSTYFYSFSDDGHRLLVSEVDEATQPVINVAVNWQSVFADGQ